jgi:hypothetical protein
LLIYACLRLHWRFIFIQSLVTWIFWQKLLWGKKGNVMHQDCMYVMVPGNMYCIKHCIFLKYFSTHMLHAIAYANSHCFSLSDLHHPSLNRLQCWFSVAWEDGDANFLFLSFNLTVLVQKKIILIYWLLMLRFLGPILMESIWQFTVKPHGCISRGKIFRFFVHSFILLCCGAYIYSYHISLSRELFSYHHGYGQ